MPFYSKDIHFHVTGLKNPKEIWDKLADLFDKKDDMRIYQLENELISLHPRNFKTLNDFFTKFKQCEVEKEDDQLILSILSKLGSDYSFFVSTFHTGKLTTPNWKMPSLNALIESLTNEHDKLV